jgi:predicted nucleic acid-binding protein
VFDASALTVFFEDKHGAGRVEDLIGQGLIGKRELLMATASLGEFGRDVGCARGAPAARQVLAKIAQLPIRLVDVDKEISLLAAELSTQFNVAYLSSIAAAVAKNRKATLVTNNEKLAVLEPEVRVGLISDASSTF